MIPCIPSVPEISLRKRQPSFQMTGEVVRIQGGDPGHQIVEKTKEMNVDFLVTGSRGLGKLRRTLMGSVSDYLVHHARIPVMVYKRTDKELDKHQ